MRCKQCAGDRQDKHGRCFYCGRGDKYQEYGPGAVIEIGTTITKTNCSYPIVISPTYCGAVGAQLGYLAGGGR